MKVVIDRGRTPEPAAEELPREAVDVVLAHLGQVGPAVAALRRESSRLAEWGEELARRLVTGKKVLAAGNGGDAAEAQHFTAELIGRHVKDRQAFPAIALPADASAVTAIGNDYGYDEVFARQVSGHIRNGDVLLVLSADGHSPNLLAAVEAAHRAGATVWALTGASPNPLAGSADEAICIDTDPSHAQEAHLIAIHALCGCFDAAVERFRKEGRI
ncbi:D-sedoheptulose-7-phosphate isomerase [Arthrobacter celericrescens]|uniref:D-sedoheptulose-7-phosphate isomerase n=1 Tax=Arthrobacter celericrescens TaxID=2320851 RepID=UPI000EA176A4|nr:SIS domain-containing protein [Arthrobacter celericrescens]